MTIPVWDYFAHADDDKKIVWFVDPNDGARSMTNSAEFVCESVHDTMPGYRIIYRDTLGNWDEMVHQDGRFLHFKPARDMGIPT